jgi:N-acetyl-1-D-myo-inositol-2-amino-2-deoxy-alpha-D-glucopyranoside deacetylase
MATIDPEVPQERPPAPDGAVEQVLEAAARAVDPLGASVDMAPLDKPRRLLLVHAHPDDETIASGATMAKYAGDGALVTLVTCTLGEEGEVLVPELAHLAPTASDGLGRHRIRELAAACEALGVTDHRFLGGAGRWRDSGMMGLATNERPDCFWQANLDEATRELVAVMREVRPQVVVTYNENGDYGHPDHIQAHRVTVAAFEASGDPQRYPDAGEPWQPAKLYYVATPFSVLDEMIEATRNHPQAQVFWGPEVRSAAELGFGVPDEVITTRIDAREHHAAKMAAMRAHATQIAVDGPFYALADGIAKEAWAVEHFQLARGERGAGVGPHRWESDLFAGVA